MTNFSALIAAALLAAPAVAGAESFEAQAAESVESLGSRDAFADVDECSTLDATPIRPWTLDEAAEHANQCLNAVGRRYRAQLTAQPALLPTSAEPGRVGLIVSVDGMPGCTVHRDVASTVERRGGRLMGFPVRVQVRGHVAPAVPEARAVQAALGRCMTVAMVREIRDGGDFVRFYGRCLTEARELQVASVRPGQGLSVRLTTQRAPLEAASLSGVVTVNPGRGPVQVMIVAESASSVAL